jgi:hypothetical protein
VVATPVAGFRDLDPPIATAESDVFVEAVKATLARPPLPPGPGPLERTPMSWTGQSQRFLEVIDAAARPASP